MPRPSLAFSLDRTTPGPLGLERVSLRNNAAVITQSTCASSDWSPSRVYPLVPPPIGPKINREENRVRRRWARSSWAPAEGASMKTGGWSR
eukprot:1185259-Prorocentrum_minimum.AAC.2